MDIKSINWCFCVLIFYLVIYTLPQSDEKCCYELTSVSVVNVMVRMCIVLFNLLMVPLVVAIAEGLEFKLFRFLYIFKNGNLILVLPTIIK